MAIEARVTKVEEVQMDELEIGKSQVRVRNVGDGIDDLANSINAVGLLEPIVICKLEGSDKYEIVTGQRRFLAHRSLGRKTILAAILDRPVSEFDAKVLSLTENLMRKDLATKDLIDVCTGLYKKYGSMQTVAEETGIKKSLVSKYVKYDRLGSELKELVDKGEVDMKVALKAQDVAMITGTYEPEEAVSYAKEMSEMSGPMQDRVKKIKQENPEMDSKSILKANKSGGKITEIKVTLGEDVHQSLKDYAKDDDTNLDSAASTLIKDALSDKGFLG
jgi:ParB family transcriptional regulator, chromosome partitioning protein